MPGHRCTIELRGLRVLAVVGVLAQERGRIQPLQLDLDVEVRRSGEDDDVASTVDYAAVCDAAAGVLATSKPRLLETVCERVAAAVLDLDARIEAVTVTTTKLRPPVEHDLATAGARLRVER